MISNSELKALWADYPNTRNTLLLYYHRWMFRHLVGKYAHKDDRDELLQIISLKMLSIFDKVNRSLDPRQIYSYLRTRATGIILSHFRKIRKRLEVPYNGTEIVYNPPLD